MSMTRVKLLMLLSLSLLSATAQTSSNTGRWIVSTDYFGTPLNPLLNLEQRGEKVTATSRGYKYVGTLYGTALHLTDANDKAHPMTLKFTAILAPALEHPQPKTHEFAPKIFYRQVSAFNKPVLTINPGDTIHTTTVDAGGTDMNWCQAVPRRQSSDRALLYKGSNAGRRARRPY
jgi:amidase